MAKRQPMKRSKDAKVFSHTAVRGKKANIYVNNSRGGRRI